MKSAKKSLAALLVLAGIGLFSVNGWAGEYTDKSYHGDEGHFYKHPAQGSFTGDRSACGR